MHVRSLFVYLQNSALDLMNMKLIRVLDLLYIVYYGDLNQIELLVNLRYLAINYGTSSTGGLPFIGKLVNLEYLTLKTSGPVFITSVMVKVMKLKYFKSTQVVIHTDCNGSQSNNFEFLSYVYIGSANDEAVLKCSPHLRKLRCRCKAFWVEEERSYRYPDFGFFTQLESLYMAASGGYGMNISLPSNIKKLSLFGLYLPWEKMSIIGGLPNLGVLKLLYDAFVGETWETNYGEFKQLEYLKLYQSSLRQWNVPFSQHFPKLQQLVLEYCGLQEIPLGIGEIATLQLIEVKGWCLESLMESARQIEREQRDLGNEELRVVFTDIPEAYT